jgi:glucose/arabinose dehydrogenase
LNKNRIQVFVKLVVAVAAAAVTHAAVAQSMAFETREIADFDEPWALEFLPDGRLLVTEKRGEIKLYDPNSGAVGDVTGVPEVAYQGQTGLGDIVLHPDFSDNDTVYLSYVAPVDGGSVVTVARARLALAGGGGSLEGLEVIWRASPPVGRGGHPGQRIAFGEGYLWISSGERQQGTPAQDMQSTMGKIIRLNMDGSVPNDNPFSDRGGVTAQIWSLGHRNPLGLAFNPADGGLWNVEMAPQGGDELNRVVRGANYGWPEVSEGVNYGGGPIPDHVTRPEFNPPEVFWLRDTAAGQSISPSSLMFYTGDDFAAWRGNAFVGGLAGEFISRIEVNGDEAREVERLDMGMRVRAIEQGPDGAIWVAEDGGRGAMGRLFKLTPRD